MKAKKMMINFILLQLAFFIYSSSSVFLKLASSRLSSINDILSPSFLMMFIPAFLLLGLYAFLWQQLIKRMELSIAYAGKSITLLWVLLWGIFLFHESITPQKVIGIALVITGVIIINRPEKGETAHE